MMTRSFLRFAGKVLLVASLILGLAACATERPRRTAGTLAPAPVPGMAAQGQVPESGPLVAGAASGSRIENIFVTSDTERLSRALWLALVSPDPEASVKWDNPATGAAGEIGVRQAYLTNVENVRGGRLWSHAGLDTSHVLEPAQGEYSVRGAAVNVRLAPSLDGAAAEKLGHGMVVDALGREPGQDWLLVARRGVVLGYVFAPLLEARGGEELMLAGGAARRPVMCRDFEQTVVMPNGVTDRWESSACRTAGGEWRVVDDVLGFTG